MVDNSLIRAHRELLKEYERLGVEEYIIKEKKRLDIILFDFKKKEWDKMNNKPVQLELKFE